MLITYVIVYAVIDKYLSLKHFKRFIYIVSKV